MMAIPTMFDGVRTRSLLEAKWACFFTLLGWRWEYEPFELEGWIPDFLIHCETGQHILVDVKPFFEGDDDYEPIQKKIEHAINSTRYITWITAAAPMSAESAALDYPPENCVGRLGRRCEGGGWWGTNAVILEPTKNKSVYGLGESYEGWWGDHITGLYGKYHYSPLKFDATRDIWKRACNEVQWRRA
jgi:hypothetical protein